MSENHESDEEGYEKAFTNVKPPPSSPEKKTSDASPEMAYLENILADLVKQGLRPLYDAVSSIALLINKSPRSLMKWQGKEKSFDELTGTLIQRGARNLNEFVYNNRVLGRDVLEMFFRMLEAKDSGEEPTLVQVQNDLHNNYPKKTRQEKPHEPALVKKERQKPTSMMIGSCFPTDVPSTVSYYQLIRDAFPEEEEEVFAPAWIFGALTNNVFRHILSETCIAAFELAEAHIQSVNPSLTIKELICSKDTVRQFGIFVAYNYLQTAVVGRVRKVWGGNGEGRGGQSVDVLKSDSSSRLWAERIVCGLDYFRNVYKRPSREYIEWRDVRMPHMREALHLAQTVQVENLNGPGRHGIDPGRVARAERRLQNAEFILQHLPQTELVYNGS